MAKGVPKKYKEEILEIFKRASLDGKVNSLNEFKNRQHEMIEEYQEVINDNEEFQDISVAEFGDHYPYRTMYNWCKKKDKFESLLGKKIGADKKTKKTKKNNENEEVKKLLDKIKYPNQTLNKKFSIDDIKEIKEIFENVKEEMKEGLRVKIKKRIENLPREKSENSKSKHNKKQERDKLPANQKSSIDTGIIIKFGVGLAASSILVLIYFKFFKKQEVKKEVVDIEDEREDREGEEGQYYQI